MERDKYTTNQAFDRLEEIEAKRRSITDKLESGDLASDVVRSSYERAAGVLDDEISSLALDSGLQSTIAQEGEAALLGRDQLEELRGILPDEELNEQIEDLSSRVSRVTAFFGKYQPKAEEAKLFIRKVAAATTAVTATVKTEPIKPPKQDVAATPEKPKTPVVVTFKRNVVQIGKRGQIVPYSNRSHDGQTDYAEPRKKALKYLLEHQGTSKDPHEIWEHLYPDGRPFDKNEMHGIRVWLKKLTFRRHPLIYFNEKRGLNSRYAAERDLVFAVEQDDDIWVRETITSVASVVQVEQEDAVVETDAGLDVEIEDTDSEEAVVNLPVNAEQIYLAANQIARFNFVLEDFGYPTIDQSVVDSLEPFAPDNSEHRNDEEFIANARAEAIQTVRDFINNEDLFLDYVDSADVESPVYKFIEYIAGLDGPEERELVDRLFGAKIMGSGRTIGTRQGLVYDNKLEHIAVDANEMPIVSDRKIIELHDRLRNDELSEREQDYTEFITSEYRRIRQTRAAELLEQPEDDLEGTIGAPEQQAEPEVVTAVDVVPTEPIPVIEPIPASEAESTDSGTINEALADATLDTGVQSEAPLTRDQLLVEEMRNEVKQYVAIFRNFFLNFDKDHQRHVYTNMVSKLKTSSVQAAKDAGIIPRETRRRREKSLSVHQAIEVLIFNDNRYKGDYKRLRREVVKIIGDELEIVRQLSRSK